MQLAMNKLGRVERTCMKNRYKWTPVVIAVVVATMIALMSAPWQSSARERPPHSAASVPEWVKNIPLWKFAGVPLDAFAVLDEGIVRKTRWGLYAFRGKKSATPCLALVDLYFGGVRHAFSVHDQHACGSGGDLGSSPITVHLGYEYQLGPNSPVVNADALGFALQSQVRRVSVEVAPGTYKTFTTRMMSQQQGYKAQVKPFRFLAFGLAREVCVGSLEGFDNEGGLVFASAPEQCP